MATADFLASDPPLAPGPLLEWIDELPIDASDLNGTIQHFINITLPPDTSAAGMVDGFSQRLEDQCWFWNRYASRVMRSGQPSLAAEVWATLYLTILSYQSKTHCRFEKSDTLANLGVALLNSGKRDAATRAWLIGVVEDSIGSIDEVESRGSYKNLLRKDVPPSVLEQLVGTVRSRILDWKVVPALPELVISLWLRPPSATPSDQFYREADVLGRELAAAYPDVPHAPSRLSRVNRYWDSLDWPKWSYWEKFGG